MLFRSVTILTEDRDKRAWPDRPVIWSPDVRLMNLGGSLNTGEHIRSLNKLCPNPLPHTWVIAQKMYDKAFVYPIVSGYAKKHKGEEEDTSRRTMRIRPKYDVSKVIQWVSDKENVNLYGTGKDFEIIMKALYDNDLESRIIKVFDSDLGKIGAYIMGKEVCYLNNNTFSGEDELLICNEGKSGTIYNQLCQKGFRSHKIFKLSDSIFRKV